MFAARRLTSILLDDVFAARRSTSVLLAAMVIAAAFAFTVAITCVSAFKPFVAMIAGIASFATISSITCSARAFEIAVATLIAALSVSTFEIAAALITASAVINATAMIATVIVIAIFTNIAAFAAAVAAVAAVAAAALTATLAAAVHATVSAMADEIASIAVSLLADVSVAVLAVLATAVTANHSTDHATDHAVVVAAALAVTALVAVPLVAAQSLSSPSFVSIYAALPPFDQEIGSSLLPGNCRTRSRGGAAFHPLLVALLLLPPCVSASASPKASLPTEPAPFSHFAACSVWSLVFTMATASLRFVRNFLAPARPPPLAPPSTPSSTASRFAGRGGEGKDTLGSEGSVSYLSDRSEGSVSYLSDHRSDSKSASNSDSDSDYDYAFGVTERLSPLTITPLATEPSASQIATWSSELPSPDAVSPTITNSALDATATPLSASALDHAILADPYLGSSLGFADCLVDVSRPDAMDRALEASTASNAPMVVEQPNVAKAVAAAKKAVADSNGDWSVCDHKTLHSLAYTLHVIRPERSSLLAIFAVLVRMTRVQSTPLDQLCSNLGVNNRLVLKWHFKIQSALASSSGQVDPLSAIIAAQQAVVRYEGEIAACEPELRSLALALGAKRTERSTLVALAAALACIMRGLATDAARREYPSAKLRNIQKWRRDLSRVLADSIDLTDASQLNPAELSLVLQD